MIKGLLPQTTVVQIFVDYDMINKYYIQLHMHSSINLHRMFKDQFHLVATYRERSFRINNIHCTFHFYCLKFRWLDEIGE